MSSTTTTEKQFQGNVLLTGNWLLALMVRSKSANSRKGGTGFIAYHILLLLLDHGFTVTASVRSKDKGESLLSVIPDDCRNSVSYVIVNDVAKDGAFDDVMTSRAQTPLKVRQLTPATRPSSQLHPSTT